MGADTLEEVKVDSKSHVKFSDSGSPNILEEGEPTGLTTAEVYTRISALCIVVACLYSCHPTMLL